MDVEAIGQSPIGELVPISGIDPRTVKPWEYWAYLPHGLLQEITGRSQNRLFGCYPVAAAING